MNRQDGALFGGTGSSVVPVRQLCGVLRDLKTLKAPGTLGSLCPQGQQRQLVTQQWPQSFSWLFLCTYSTPGLCWVLRWWWGGLHLWDPRACPRPALGQCPSSKGAALPSKSSSLGASLSGLGEVTHVWPWPGLPGQFVYSFGSRCSWG